MLKRLILAASEGVRVSGTFSKRGKNHAFKARLVLVVLLIGWKNWRVITFDSHLKTSLWNDLSCRKRTVTGLLFFPHAHPQFAFILCTRLFYFESPYEHTLLVPTADEPCAAQSDQSKVQWSSCQDKPTDTGAHVADAIVSWDAVRHWNNTRQGNGEKRVNKQTNTDISGWCLRLPSQGLTPPPPPPSLQYPSKIDSFFWEELWIGQIRK